MTGEAFFKNSIALNISREMALDFGLVEATEAEKRKRDEERAAFQARKAEAQPRFRAALAALGELDGIERKVLDLHSVDPRNRYSRSCEGCDFGGYEGESPEWPCRTVDLIAEAHDIDLREFWLVDLDHWLDHDGGDDITLWDEPLGDAMHWTPNQGDE